MKKRFTIAYIAGILAAALSLPAVADAQQQQETAGGSNTVKAAANKQYNTAGKFKRILLGEHYRKEWATEVDVEILDIDSVGGGLTPVKVGGGLQTKSLRLKAANGKEYVLRSVNKDPSKAIVAELRGTFADDIVQDQISSSHPYAPMVVASMANAAGIFHSTPKIVYVPHSEKLGTFNAEFAGTLCLLEERPEGNQENNAAVGYSKKVVNSEKLLEKVFTNSDHQVDEKAFLKARLFDMLIGDWDRHEDQWQWAAFEKEDKTFYQPIPRDRDQSFTKMDGVIPGMATKKWALRKIKDFDYTIHDPAGLNSNGMRLDRNFTTRLVLEDWLRVAASLQKAISDDVIETAFNEMPPAIYAISGNEIKAKLKRRRDYLLQSAADYYAFISREINVTGTKEKEFFEVTRVNDDMTTVTVYKIDDDGDKGKVIFKRTFLRSETKEIRLYGLGGNDQFQVNGETKKGMLVRVIGGDGDDSVTDHSIVRQAGHQTKVYDNENILTEGTHEAKEYVSSDSLKNQYNRRGFVFDWLSPTFNPGYNPDDGFFIGGGLIYKKQQFGKAPYGFMQSIGGNYAFSTGAYSAWYNGIFTSVVGKSDLHVGAKYYSPTYTRNFYGLGNETVNDETASSDYYRVRISGYSLSSALQRKLGKSHTLSVGAEFQSVKVEDNEGRFISTGNSKFDSSDFERKYYSNFRVAYQFSTINNELYPTKGIRVNSSATYTVNLEENDKNFIQLFTEAAFYNSFGPVTIASRAGVAANLNDDYEFYQANTLGHSANLRGFRKDRFAGKTSVYQSTEVRWAVSYVNAYVVKGSWGVLGFMDNGRVWAPDEESDTWHRGYGGGLWFLPFNKMALTGTYGTSKEGNMVSIKAGFQF